MPRRSSASVQIFYPEFTRKQLIETLKQRLPALEAQVPLRFVVLFGSYGRGNYTVASDVDLLVVYRGPRNEDAFALVKKTLDVPRLEPHVYTEEEYRALAGTIARMVRDGTVLLSRLQ